jgi:uncharacterized protein (TIGR02453 family)
MNRSFELQTSLVFLAGLSQNNYKAWFEQNRAAYQHARDNFENFIADMIDELRGSDQLQSLTAKECIARIYRDIRFSKDKSPYHTNFSALIAPGGRKSGWYGYYVSIEPQGRSMVAGGLYMPDTEQLGRFRQAVDRDAAGLKDITGSKLFIEQFGRIQGERLKTAPKGYDKAHPEIDLLQLKQVAVMHYFPDAEVLAGNFQEQALATCRAMKPFLSYLNEVLK